MGIRRSFRSALSRTIARGGSFCWGIVMALFGVGLLVWNNFLLGQVLIAGGLVLMTVGPKGKKVKSDPTFHYGFARPLLLVSIIVWVFSWYAAEVEFVSDFVALYTGAELARNDPTALYDVESQVEVENRLLRQEINRENVLLFLYPPLIGFLMVPLSWFSFDVSYQLWFVLNLYVFALGLYLLSSWLRLSRSQIQVLVSVALIWFPVYQTLAQGQNSFFALIVVSCFVLAFRRSDSASAGAWAGLLILKPQFLPIPGLLLLIKRQWRGVLVAATLGTLVGFVPLVAVGFKGLTDLVALYGRMASGDPVNADFSRMHNLRALTHYVGLGDGGWIAGATLVLALLILVFLRDEHDSVWALVALVLAMLLVSPHLQGHDLVLLLIPAGLWLSVEAGSPTRGQWLLFLGLSLLVLLRLTVLTNTLWPIVPVALLALFGIVVWSSLVVSSGIKSDP